MVALGEQVCVPARLRVMSRASPSVGASLVHSGQMAQLHATLASDAAAASAGGVGVLSCAGRKVKLVYYSI